MDENLSTVGRFERDRSATIKEYRLDTPHLEADLNRIAQLATEIFHVKSAQLAFIDENCEIIKGAKNISTVKNELYKSFCARFIDDKSIVEINDTHLDPCFKDHPYVQGAPFIRSYTSHPIDTPDGFRLGSLCLIDTAPRPPLTEHQRELLRSLTNIAVDHLERRRLDTVLHAAMQIAAATPDAIVCSDENGTVTFWNDAAERVFGYTRDEMLGRPYATLVPTEFHAHHREVMEGCFAMGKSGPIAQTIEVIARKRDETRIPVEVSLATWRDGEHGNIGWIIRDLSERDRARERVRHLTHFDRLTDLPNRAQFLERIDNALSGFDRFAVLKAGLDRFKTVNGTIGMMAGDRVLVTAAERIREEVGLAACVARLGGDEFGILLTGADAASQAVSLAERLVGRLGEPFHVGASVCHLGVSIGVVRDLEASCSIGADVVLKRALLALQHAKMAGGGRFEFFQPQLGQRAEERRRIEEELRGALERGEFELHFQPQVALPGGVLTGAEALLRWRHPERGLLSPAMFLPVLETSAMAVPVGRWIIQEACAFGALMKERGVPLRMGANLFAFQLRDAGLFAVVADALTATSLPARLFELEITETTVLGLDESTIEPLRRLRGLGVGIAFDDYGTGYASLSLLKRYPLTRLKIDREFVRDLHADPDDAAIVKAVIALGASLGLDVIAEGIETHEQAQALVAFGCHEAQGYLFGKPMAAVDFVAHHVAPTIQKRA